MTSARCGRRGFCRSAGAWALAAALAPKHGFADQAAVPLDWFDPFKPAELYFRALKPLFFDRARGMPYLDALWRLYTTGKDLGGAERTLMGMYLIWRIMPTKADRIRIAQAAQKMALQVRGDYPKSAAGHVWSGVFAGAEALTRGALDSAHILPEVDARLTRAEEIDPAYVHGMTLGVKAKLYVKAPSFPVGMGNLDKGFEYLEKARPYQEKKYALWYMFLAEAELQARGQAAAFAVLDRMREEVKPVDVTTAYLYDTALVDAEAFKKAVREGTYNRYLWDPLLEMARPGLS